MQTLPGTFLLTEKIIAEDLLPFGGTVLVVVLSIALARRFTLSRPERGGYRGQLALFLFIVVGLLAVLVALPLESKLSSQVFSLVGIVLSAAIALSSTTFLGNLIAGGMLRTVRHFELGDWVRVGEHFGRVTERGLLHTEIQTADRDLTTLPNLLLATEPVKVVRSSGTIVSANVGLGFDVPHARVEPVLLDAARDVELTDAFVAVDEIGDFAVTYRLAGKLLEVERLISTRSQLRRAMLDRLHGAGIEIMSPHFYSVAMREAGETVIPERVRSAPKNAKAPEEVAFDKADAAKGLEQKRATLAEVEAKLVGLEKRIAAEKGEIKAASEAEHTRMRAALETLREEVAATEADLADRST